MLFALITMVCNATCIPVYVDNYTDKAECTAQAVEPDGYHAHAAYCIKIKDLTEEGDNDD